MNCINLYSSEIITAIACLEVRSILVVYVNYIGLHISILLFPIGGQIKKITLITIKTINVIQMKKTMTLEYQPFW